MKDFLKKLLNTLCALDVKGKDNMELVLGCIYAIENKIAELEREETDGE